MCDQFGRRDVKKVSKLCACLVFALGLCSQARLELVKFSVNVTVGPARSSFVADCIRLFAVN